MTDVPATVSTETPSMHTVSLGRQGLHVPAEGLGAKGMTVGRRHHDDAAAVDALDRAIDLGMNFIDTADMYGPFDNERLIGKVLAWRRDAVVVATKFGIDFAWDGTPLGPDGSPEHVRRAIDRSLRNLCIDVVDLYYLHHVDPVVPIEETVGAMGQLIAAGKVRHIGVARAAPEEIRRAHATFPLSAVQASYSFLDRNAERTGLLDMVLGLGIGFVARSPLARGPGGDLLAVSEFRDLATSKGVTPAQLALAWAMAQGAVPVAGTTRREHVEENAAAADVPLSAADLEVLEGIAQTFGIAADVTSPAGLA